MNKTLEEAVSFEYALLETYKKLQLSEKEVLVLLMVNHLLKKGNALIMPSTLAMVMNYSEKEIDEVLSGFITKKYFNYSLGDENRSPIDGAKTIIYNSLFYEVLRGSDRDVQKRIAYFSHRFEDLYQRPLSPIERETIRNWIDDGYSDDEIQEAIQNTNAKTSLKRVENELKAARKRKEEDKNNASSPDENISTSSPALEIAKKFWNNEN